MDAGFGGGDGPIADHSAVGYPHLAGQDHPMAEFGAACNAHLGGQGAAFAGGYPMADLHQVVDFGACADPGFAHRWAIDGGAAAHLHRLFQHHQPRLGHFSPSLGRGNKAKTLAAHHRVGMHHALGG